jgi:hypothetical protein
VHRIDDCSGNGKIGEKTQIANRNNVVGKIHQRFEIRN